MDGGGDPLIGRRQFLRWGTALGLATTLGCTPTRGDDPGTAPRPETPGTGPQERAEVTGEAAVPAGPVPTVEVVCRDAVGLLVAQAGGHLHDLRRLTLHHSALPLTDDAAAPAQLRQHQRFHREQGWVDIAYHFAVDRRGNVYELRDPAVASDTFTDYDPAGHLGVVCEGDYSLQHPTEAMLEATALVLAHAATTYQLAPGTLAGHRDHALTRCPGDHLAAHLPQLQLEVERLASDTVDRIEVCGATGRERVATIEQGA